MYSDFGYYPQSMPCASARPEALSELQQIVRRCFDRDSPMRMRGNAHSMNGMSVPRPDETLLDMTGVRHLEFDGAGKVTAGAGLSVWETDRYVRSFGWQLPVVNDGNGAAATIGGFIAGGGFATPSAIFGGIWEIVDSVTLIAADGTVHGIPRSHPLFPWLFGSLGAFGVIYEATVRLIPCGDAPGAPVANQRTLPVGESKEWPRDVWLTVVVPAAQRQQALDFLKDVGRDQHTVWKPKPRYDYFIRFRRFNPPLLCQPETDIFATGIWGEPILTNGRPERYFAFEEEFQRRVSQAGFRRYFQIEKIWQRRELDEYVGPIVATGFRRLKDVWDPRHLLNRGAPG